MTKRGRGDLAGSVKAGAKALSKSAYHAAVAAVREVNSKGVPNHKQLYGNQLLQHAIKDSIHAKYDLQRVQKMADGKKGRIEKDKDPSVANYR